MFVQGPRVACEKSDNSDEASDEDECGGDVLQVVENSHHSSKLKIYTI